MEIIVGKTAGFCYGVRRAVEGAQKELKETTKTICCLGEIVHNKQVIENLEKQGMKSVENVRAATGKTIIRAHGVPKETYKIANEQGIEIIDYTCPNVLKIHKIAEEYSGNGYYIFLCGSSVHPENIGTISYCGKYYSVIEKIEEIEKAWKEYQKSGRKKVVLISQTTYSLEKFREMEAYLRKRTKQEELLVNCTICHATELRQKETKELAQMVDAMIIIGGRNSSNTKKLYEIAKENCAYSICVEGKEEILLGEIRKYKKIGIMAGASTPQESIEEVIKEIECTLNV